MAMQFPVDNKTYDLMQTLVSKLEALEAYQKYEKDGVPHIFQKMYEDDSRHARELLDELRQMLH